MDVAARLEAARKGLEELRAALQSPSAGEGRMESLATGVVADLRAAIEGLGTGAPPAGLRARLASVIRELRGAAVLSSRGCRLYDGWMQVLSLWESGYTAGGEPGGVSIAGHLDVQG